MKTKRCGPLRQRAKAYVPASARETRGRLAAALGPVSGDDAAPSWAAQTTSAETMEDVGQWLKTEIRFLEEGSAVIKLMNRVQSSRVLLRGLTPTSLQAHTLPRRPSLPLLLDGDVDEDTVADWKKEFFGDDEADDDEKKDDEDEDEGEDEEEDEDAKLERENAEAEAAALVEAEEKRKADEAAAERKRLQRSRSLLLSPTEVDARALRALTEPRSIQEQADEAQVPKKLAYARPEREIFVSPRKPMSAVVFTK